MELSDTELASMNTLHDAALWAGLGGNARTSLFQLLGVEGTTPVRNMGIIPVEDYKSIISMWTLPAPTTADPTATVPPTANQVGQAGLVGRACRVKCGTEPNRIGTSPAAAVATASGSAEPPPKKVKLSNVIDQTNDTEEAVLDKGEIQAAYDRYKKSFGDYPPADEEPTCDQLTALRAVCKAGSRLLSISESGDPWI